MHIVYNNFTLEDFFGRIDEKLQKDFGERKEKT